MKTGWSRREIRDLPAHESDYYLNRILDSIPNG